ncbi:MAG: hypothetical protein WCO91_06130, partial [Gemmataceae bacterium]
TSPTNPPRDSITFNDQSQSLIQAGTVFQTQLARASDVPTGTVVLGKSAQITSNSVDNRTEIRVRLDIQLLLPSPLSVFLGAEATIPGLTPWPSVFGRIPQIKELPPSKINLVLFFQLFPFIRG